MKKNVEVHPNHQKIREKDLIFENAMQIFALNGRVQNQCDILKVLPTMLEVDFFASFCPENSTLEEFAETCIAKLQYEEFDKGEAVFHYSEVGDKFYIILSGQAGVYVPKDVQRLPVEEHYSSKRHSSVLSNHAGLKADTVDKKRKFSRTPIQEAEMLALGPSRLEYTQNYLQNYQLVFSYFAGQSFGELALTTDKQRAASIIALSDLKLVSLSKQNYRRVFEKKRIQSMNQKIDYFMKMYSQVTRFNMHKFVLNFKELSVPQNVYLWKEMEDVNCFIVLIQGQVQVELNINDPCPPINEKEKLTGFLKKQHKTKIIFSVLSDGHLIGIDDVLCRRDKRQYSCRTLVASKFYMMSSDNFNLIRKSYPEIIKSMNGQNRVSSQWLSERKEKLIDLKSGEHQNEEKQRHHYVERRRVDELEQQYQQALSQGLLDKFDGAINKRLSKQFHSPPPPPAKTTIRSVEAKKATKQQLVQQNYKLFDILQQTSEEAGIEKDFNMLKMADANIQKSLKIRVEKHYENFQPSKPKYVVALCHHRQQTPSFTQIYRSPDSIRSCLSSHKLSFKSDPLQKAQFVNMFAMTQLDSADMDPEIIRAYERDAYIFRKQYTTPASSDHMFGRIINPLIQLKTRTWSKFHGQQLGRTMQHSSSHCETDVVKSMDVVKSISQQDFQITNSMRPTKKLSQLIRRTHNDGECMTIQNSAMT